MWAMRSSYFKYLYFIVTLTVFCQYVKAQYEFSQIFYPLTRNITRNINNWQRVDVEYVNVNRIGSNRPPSDIKFTYTDDTIKIVGDYCYAKGAKGVCTLTKKCSEVVRDIKKGRTPTICPHQSSETVVCCPKRNRLLNQQVYDSNQISQVYSTQQAYQRYQSNKVNQPNQVSQFYQFNQVYQGNQVYQPNKVNKDNVPPPPQTTTHPAQNIQSFLLNRNPELRRRSEQKCEEYSRLTTRSVSFASLSILTSTQEVNIPTCTYTTELIVGGDVAKVGEFPHMAAIGWTSSGEVNWKCGGSLISDYFVLTAGHCSALYGVPPDIVRLGDQNLIRHDDNAEPQDFQITNIFVHPEYRHSAHYNDIALLKLNRQVIFTRFVRPACLWQSYYINSTKTIATGWGQVKFAGVKSDDLRKVALNIIDNPQCNQLYESSRRLRHGIVRSQMCAGYIGGGKDTCQGDSGGPIQVITPRNQCVFHIVGVTSFGTACAAVNTAGVYTRVSSYLDWIESNVWP